MAFGLFSSGMLTSDLLVKKTFFFFKQTWNKNRADFQGTRSSECIKAEPQIHTDVPDVGKQGKSQKNVDKPTRTPSLVIFES